MALSKKLMAGGLAALALLATTASAFAAPAFATGNVNVRSGPGTQYGRVDVLVRGERVDVQQCRGSWCYILQDGPAGWVSASYLQRTGSGGGWNDNNWGRPPQWNPAPPPPPQWNPYPPRPPQWNPNPPRPPHWNPAPPRPQPWPTNPGNSGSVCFNGPNGYFCVGN